MESSRKASFPANAELSLSDEVTPRPYGYRELTELVPAVLWRADAQTFQFTFVSRYAETLLGYPLQRWTEELAFWRDHLYPEDREWVAERRSHAVGEGGEYDFEYRMVSSDGSALWVREVARAPERGSGEELVGVIVDLSKKRSGRRAVGEDKLWLRQVIDTIPVQIWSGASDGTLDFVNAGWRTELGLGLGDVQGERWQRLLHPDDLDRVLEAWCESVTSGRPFAEELRIRRGEGQYRWLLMRGVPLREDGRIIRWFGANCDIEDQKQAEAALRKSEERWRSVFENTRIGVALLDASLHILDANEAYQKMMGYTADELRSMTAMDVTNEQDRPSLKLVVDEMMSGKRDHFDVEKRNLQKNGDSIWVRVNGSSFGSGEARLWVAMVADISERKRLHVQLHRERDRLRLLLDLNTQFISKLELPDFFVALAMGLRRVDGWESAAILLPEPSTNNLRLYLAEGIVAPSVKVGTLIPLEPTIAGKVYKSGQAEMFRFGDLAAEHRQTEWYQDIVRAGLKVGCALPLVQNGRVLGVLVLGTGRDQESATHDLSFLQELANLIAMSLSNALRYDQLIESHEKLVDARNWIEDQIRTEFSFETIVGASKAIKEVLKQVDTVAPTDSAVLILGETGTGKELVARAICERSLRHDKGFIKVDCAAIPGPLMESELFGHEKGAFTGATRQRLGRFEIADKGTLFLDEVGEIPLELQPKLLRVLQDRTFERLGSNRTRQVDVRIIAATHRNLEELVDRGQFRQDLYYRLKVFPITIPPLRERPEDIPPLVKHYLAKYAQRTKKQILTIPAHAMEVFTRYPWPGNVRELQHFLERSVILSPGSVLQAPLRELEEAARKEPPLPGKRPARNRTMEEIERQSILQALRDSNWVVGGPHGAAAKLGLKRTTLASRMESLGISRHQK